MPPLLPHHRLVSQRRLRPSLSSSPSSSTILPFLLPSSTAPSTTALTSSIQSRVRPLHTTPALQAASQRIRPDKRITLIRYHLTHPLTPRPLRLSRLRTLRHWTIHRAWQLHRRRERTARERELERQYNSMARACEELRLLEGEDAEPKAKAEADAAQGKGEGAERIGNDNTRLGGRLYRRAMEKKGVFQLGGWPIEAGRGMVEWPGREVWAKDWKR